MKNRNTVQNPKIPTSPLGKEPDEREGVRTADRLNIRMRRTIYTEWKDVYAVLIEEADRRRVPFSQLLREVTYEAAAKIAKEHGKKAPQRRYTEDEK